VIDMVDIDTPVISIGMLAASGRHLITECLDCGHCRKIPADRITLPPDTPAAQAGKHMRCTQCRGKTILTRPESMRDARRGISER
jgi:hypothetical protein